jgi:hypothetical protein
MVLISAAFAAEINTIFLFSTLPYERASSGAELPRSHTMPTPPALPAQRTPQSLQF